MPPVAGVVVVDRRDAKRFCPLRCRQFEHVAVTLAVTHRERFRHDHRVLADRLPQLIARVCRALEQEVALVEHHVKGSGAQRGEVAVVDQVDIAELVERDHIRM
jgi:hypothetical protein